MMIIVSLRLRDPQLTSCAILTSHERIDASTFAYKLSINYPIYRSSDDAVIYHVIYNSS